ncbi:ATP-binding protein [Actinomadura darangshiensis]|uniref:ATP-binding protein n=1 Tax=Actinomadura darangshiensis TaxID=705336 RepID=A0A4R4ZS97_9ACTN|nr:ATP-binding protein [Actinomadura darangshiensis]
MPLEPRFRRVAALHRPFVDREAVMAAFADVLRVRDGSPHIFNLVGVGGIGKSRLLQELGQRSAETHRTTTIDLQVPAMRQQADALAVLRVELGRQGVRFDRFDIAYAVLWQRLHPHLRLSPESFRSSPRWTTCGAASPRAPSPAFTPTSTAAT